MHTCCSLQPQITQAAGSSHSARSRDAQSDVPVTGDSPFSSISAADVYTPTSTCCPFIHLRISTQTKATRVSVAMLADLTSSITAHPYIWGALTLLITPIALPALYATVLRVLIWVGLSPAQRADRLESREDKERR